MNDTAQLKPKLSRLRMSGILDNLDMRIRQAEESKWSYSEFLLTLFQDEIERRECKALALRLKRSELDSQKTLETFDFAFNTRIHAATLKELATCSFVERKENIFLLGPSGVGKSHLAAALGHEACRRGYDVFFRRTHTLLKWIHAGRADGSSERKLQALTEIPLLILDDFGLNDMTASQQSDLYELICARYEKSSTIITSNRDINEWQSMFENPLIGSAAVDRLVHRTIEIEVEGPSYRRENFIQKNGKNLTTNKS